MVPSCWESTIEKVETVCMFCTGECGSIECAGKKVLQSVTEY
jgi:hypothetical protein